MDMLVSISEPKLRAVSVRLKTSLHLQTPKVFLPIRTNVGWLFVNGCVCVCVCVCLCLCLCVQVGAAGRSKRPHVLC